MKKISIILVIACVGFAACKKKDKDEPCPVEDTEGTINFHFHHIVGPNAFAFNTDFTDDFGTTYQFTRADWYLHIPGFLEHDNVTPTISNDVYFKMDPAVNMATYGDVPEGDYHNLQWAVGVDSATNHLDPNTYETGSALSNQSPSMHWGWSTGYIFCVLEGLVDADGSGTYDTGETFALHVGMDTNYRQGMSIHADAVVTAGATADIHLDVNYAKFLEGIDLATENSTHTMDNMPLAVKVANNFDKVLSTH